jgi:hypothetical protein
VITTKFNSPYTVGFFVCVYLCIDSRGLQVCLPTTSERNRNMPCAMREPDHLTLRTLTFPDFESLTSGSRIWWTPPVSDPKSGPTKSEDPIPCDAVPWKRSHGGNLVIPRPRCRAVLLICLSLLPCSASGIKAAWPPPILPSSRHGQLSGLSTLHTQHKNSQSQKESSCIDHSGLLSPSRRRKVWRLASPSVLHSFFVYVHWIPSMEGPVLRWYGRFRCRWSS